jgi:dsRNA-specific ribonuclease
VAVFLNEEQYSVNSGKSMKEAQKNAASDALKFIDKNKDIENEKN